MECACIESYDFDCEAEFHTEKEVKARKTHICYECGREINKGEIYEKVFGKWDGLTHTYKTCFDCLSVRNEFFCSWYYGQVWSDLKEYLTPGECLDKAMLKITERSRGKILDIIDVED
jgi:hypothetical protein